MRMVSQFKLENQYRSGSKRTIRVYHTYSGDANTISFLFRNVERNTVGKLKTDTRDMISTLFRYKVYGQYSMQGLDLFKPGNSVKV